MWVRRGMERREGGRKWNSFFPLKYFHRLHFRCSALSLLSLCSCYVDRVSRFEITSEKWFCDDRCSGRAIVLHFFTSCSLTGKPHEGGCNGISPPILTSLFPFRCRVVVAQQGDPSGRGQPYVDFKLRVAF